MNIFELELLKTVKTRLSHLPGFCRLAIYELLPYCDFSTGEIIVKTLQEIASEFQIESAPGRKKENITADTIRNAFRTIKKARPHDFIFKVVNQRIIIEMPFLRELYQQKVKEDAAVNGGDVYTSKALAVIEKSHQIAPNIFVDVVIEDVAASFSQGSNNKKQNKTTTTTAKLISQDFYPTETTISAALQEGLTNAQDENEIKAFINYNQAKGSLWADFNPVYLRWLRRAKIHNQEQQIKKEQQTVTQGLRRFGNATTSTRKDTPHNAVQKAILLNQQIINDNENASLETSLSFDGERHGQTLDGHGYPVRPAIFEQAW